MEMYGYGDMRLKECSQDVKVRQGYVREKDDYGDRGYYVRGKDKKAPSNLELAKVLLEKNLRDRGADLTHAECRLYKFLQFKEQELQEAGLLDIPVDDPEKGVKGKKKGEILDHLLHTKR